MKDRYASLKAVGSKHGRWIETQPLETLYAVKLMQGRVLVYSSRYVDSKVVENITADRRQQGFHTEYGNGQYLEM